MKSRIAILDYLKTLAIIAVVFYHINILPNGYLGVEIFFVINGYLFFMSSKEKFANNRFRWFNFIGRRLAQFWPLVLVGGLIALIIGYFLMLPDDLESLAQSIVASNFFANNILQAITTANYWDVINIFKPFMHTWYIGVLMQLYIFLPLVILIVNKLFKRDLTKQTLAVITVISLILYLMPQFSTAWKFYFLPFRLWEVGLGGLLAYMPKLDYNKDSMRTIGNLAFLVLVFMIFTQLNFCAPLMYLLAVFATLTVIWTHSSIEEDYGLNQRWKQFLSLPGKYSYDIYIWHQIAIAFLYYAVFTQPNIWLVLLVLLVTAVMSTLSVQARLNIGFLQSVSKRLILSLILLALLTALALVIHRRDGVVRDVPELGIDEAQDAGNYDVGAYTDRVYDWDNDFVDDGRLNILIIGDSYGRDFANILAESAYSDELQISYIFGSDAAEEMARVEAADLIFYASFGWTDSEWVLENIPLEKLYIVGNKSFGNSLGIVYTNRHRSDYFQQTNELSEEFILNNDAARGRYGDMYIDMITPLTEDGEIKVFTDNNYFISQDTRHLTPYGAEYYSRLLNLEELLQP